MVGTINIGVIAVASVRSGGCWDGLVDKIGFEQKGSVSVDDGDLIGEEGGGNEREVAESHGAVVVEKVCQRVVGVVAY